MAKDFDPNAAAIAESGIFGLPYKEQDAALVYVPVPWEATTSYGGGASRAPAAILGASRQVDLFDYDVLRPYEAGLYMRPRSAKVRTWNREAKPLAAKVIHAGGCVEGNRRLLAAAARVNALGNKLNAWVFEQVDELFSGGKIPAVVGGDHSTPFGAFQAAAKRYSGFGILHFDAHSDTRDAFEGFTWSHASIMRNALERIPELEKIVQVGVRDVCEEELRYCEAQGDRVEIFFDRDLAERKFAGENWRAIAENVIAGLPGRVWVSFDIDGLDPTLCPHTGTPVPGGLSFNEACALLTMLARSGRKIIGFDLNEVAPSLDAGDEWDSNVGARLLYKLSALTLATQGQAKFLEGSR